MARQDWLLLALANGGPYSPVQLQKSLFLLGKQFPENVGTDYYTFQPYDYGPFDSAVYADADKLQTEGWVSIENPLDRGWRRYSTTESGAALAAKFADTLPADVKTEAVRLATWVKEQTFVSLVRAVYEKYPEYKAHSVFKG